MKRVETRRGTVEFLLAKHRSYQWTRKVAGCFYSTDITFSKRGEKSASSLLLTKLHGFSVARYPVLFVTGRKRYETEKEISVETGSVRERGFHGSYRGRRLCNIQPRLGSFGCYAFDAKTSWHASNATLTAIYLTASIDPSIFHRRRSWVCHRCKTNHVPSRRSDSRGGLWRNEWLGRVENNFSQGNSV